MAYTIKTNAEKHICWDNPEWDGLLSSRCAGCDEAVKHPCNFCGYGRAFTTHNDIAHAENGDDAILSNDEWFDSPHIY